MRNLHRRFVLCSASQIYGRNFAKFCGLLRIYELYRSSRRSMSIVTMKSKLNLLKFDSDVSQLGRACSWISIFLFPILRPPCDATLALCTANYFHIKIGIQIKFQNTQSEPLLASHSSEFMGKTFQAAQLTHAGLNTW